MADPQLSQLERLRRSMEVLESQRANLGDDAVDPALFALEQQIAVLEDGQRADVDVAEDRRIVTILFTDIVGSSAIASRLDPEDWREVVAALHRMAGETVQEFGGTVVQYLGDGLLALFGAHSSSERDPESAVCSALEIQKNVLHLEINEPIQLRAGINTGLVVTGELGSEAKREFTASGEAMNIAARLQEAAPVGGVLISHSTYRHIRGLFDMSLQFPLREKERVVPIQTYLVTKFRQRPYRLASRGVGGVVTATIGREAEIRELQTSFRKALKTNELIWTQLVGRPGVGKSRLISDFSELLEWQPEQTLVFRAYAVEGDSKRPYALVRRMWFDHFLIPDNAPFSEMESLWVKGVQSYLGQDSEEAAHALGLLIGLPFLDSPHIGVMRDDPKQLKLRAFAVSRELFSHLRSSKLLVLLIEDLHWADPSSWDYITQVMLDSPNRQYGTFFLAAARPEWNPSDMLLDHRGYLQIDLQPLSQAASFLLAAELLQKVELVPEKVLNLIADRSEGVPYFAEEIVNWLIDQRILDISTDPWRFASSQFEDSPLPPTLQHLLQARLSALRSEFREVLQYGSIFGREFWEGGLQALGALPDPTTMNGLEARGFIEVQPTSSFEGEREWRFHHSLMRDVVYESILKRHRSDLHREAGAWLERQARKADRLEDLAGLIGEHAERAGEKSAAADWYFRAGKHSKAHGGQVEARDFFAHTLELLPVDERQRRWLALLELDGALAALGSTENQKEGLASLNQLAEEFDEPSRLVEANYRQAVFFVSMGETQKALDISRYALQVARDTGKLELEPRLLALMIVSKTRAGELEEAAILADELLARSEELEDETDLALILTNVAVFYSQAGDIGKAVELVERQIKINHQTGDRIGEAIGLGNIGYNYIQLGQFERARVALERSLKLHEALGIRRMYAYNTLNLGLCDWRSGNAEAAVGTMGQALGKFEAIADAFGRGSSLLYLALALEHLEDFQRARKKFAGAKEIFAEVGMFGLELDAIAGLARCSLAGGTHGEAQKYVTGLWDHLSHDGATGMEFPVLVYQTCATVFDSLGDEEKSKSALDAGYQTLMTQADKISNMELRQSYLDNVPENRTLFEMWSRKDRG